MEYYSRTARRDAASQPPGTSFTPDGHLSLAMPVRTRTQNGTTRVEQPASSAVNRPAGDSLVLMKPPNVPDGEEASYFLLLLVACDVGTMAYSLTELRFRQIYFDNVVLSVTAGIVVDIGLAVSVRCGWPILLGLFAIAAFTQCTEPPTSNTVLRHDARAGRT